LSFFSHAKLLHSTLRKISVEHRCFIHRFCKLIKNLLTSVIADKIAENMMRFKHGSFIVAAAAAAAAAAPAPAAAPAAAAAAAESLLLVAVSVS